MGRPRKPKPLKGLVREHPKPGVIALYYRAAHGPRYRIQVGEDHPDFHLHYSAARAGHPLPAPVASTASAEPTSKLDRWPLGSLGALIDAYSKSAAFHELRPQGQRSRLALLFSCCDELMKNGKKIGTVPAAKFEPRHAQFLFDQKAGLPGAANNRIKYLRILFGWADIQPDPTRRVRKLKPIRQDGWHMWTPAELAAYEQHHKLGTTPRLVFDLAIYTAARRGDLVTLGRASLIEYEGKPWLSFKQGKTGGVVELPILEELLQSIAAMPSAGATFIATGDGKPYSANGIGNAFTAWRNQVPLLKRSPTKRGQPRDPNACSLHGLRKSAASRLAELGCGENEIQAITGHATSREVQRYTKGARRKIMASSAMKRLMGDLASKPKMLTHAVTEGTGDAD